ncbi:MAG: hypothetical protein CUN57_04015, partial [Phototrophicales bacterium]
CIAIIIIVNGVVFIIGVWGSKSSGRPSFFSKRILFTLKGTVFLEFVDSRLNATHWLCIFIGTMPFLLLLIMTM